MSVSKVQICNLALTELGAGTISNYDTDTSEKAVLCRIYYDLVVSEVLRSHEWNCAIWYQSLAPLASTDEDYLLTDYDKYDYQYQLPTVPLCLRPLEIPEYPTYPYEIASGYLLTDLDTVVLKYIKLIEDTTKFDPLLVRAIAYRLAADIAPRITNARKTRTELLATYDWQITKGVHVDGQESENPQIEEYLIRDAKDS